MQSLEDRVNDKINSFVSGLVVEDNKLPINQQNKLRGLLFDKGMNSDNHLFEAYSRKEENENIEYFFEKNLLDGSEGYTYVSVPQEEDEEFKKALKKPIDKDGKKIALTLGTIATSVSGMMYATLDQPYAFEIALGSIAVFFVGLGVATEMYNADQKNKSLADFNPVTDTKSAISLALDYQRE